MSDLTFVTGNPLKFRIASDTFAAAGLELGQGTFEIDEIQSEDPEKIVTDKLNKAYDILQSPVLVNDDSWSIHGLNGFPGPYMKSVTHWFSSQDFINLTRNLNDRRVTLSQWIGFTDGHTHKILKLEYSGELLPEVRGNASVSWQNVVTMSGDKGLSISEVVDTTGDMSGREVARGWSEFIKWYQENITP
jgi:inosine/xanthosine triphosphate pyrophosphatase family protein